VTFRLSPQHVFPAALLDVLVAYLSLLYPPPGSLHEPVPASNIIFSGDSCSASLQASLIQLIIATRKIQGTDAPTVLFHNQRVVLPMPAGLTTVGLAGDQTFSVPSWEENEDKDIFPDVHPATLAKLPGDHIWPVSPPRFCVYCDNSLLAHPLISPTVATDWTGAPPMWFAVGTTERLLDSARLIAQTAARQGVVVRWEQFERMPHIWPMIFRFWPQTGLAVRKWAKACADFAGGRIGETKGTTVRVEGLREESVDVTNLTDFTCGEAEKRMRDAIERYQAFAREHIAKAKL